MSRGVLLDTHALLWLAAGTDLSRAAVDRIETAILARQCYVSAVTAWELGFLERRKSVSFAMPLDVWWPRTVALTQLIVLPMNDVIAIRSSRLGEWTHQDLADRLLAATAFEYELTLMTRDAKLMELGRLGIISISAC